MYSVSADNRAEWKIWFLSQFYVALKTMSGIEATLLIILFKNLKKKKTTMINLTTKLGRYLNSIDSSKGDLTFK